jgi:hypothetical protein
MITSAAGHRELMRTGMLVSPGQQHHHRADAGEHQRKVASAGSSETSMRMT